MAEDVGGDEKQNAEKLFVEAYNMPAGMPRHEALERAARAADASGHLPLGVSCRVALVRSTYDLSRYDLMLAPFAWLRTAQEKDPSAFDDWERHSFDWSFKWISNGLTRDPRFSLAQIESTITQLAERYGQLGYSVQPVHSARAALAHHVGDVAGLTEHLGKYLATERGPMADCAACVVEEQVEHLTQLGRFDEAVRHGWAGLQEETNCSTQPQGILTTLLRPLLAVGDVERAAHAHLTASRLIKDDTVTNYVHEHLRFCALTGNVERGVEILRRSLHKVTAAMQPLNEMSFAESASVLLQRVPADLAFDVPQVGVLSAEALLARLTARARELAAAFDARNGTSAVSERLEAGLAETDLVVVPLAVPTAAPVVAEPVPVATGDPVEIASLMLQAYEEGDFVSGRRLLDSLPADMDALLPPDLAAHAVLRRMLSGDQPFDREVFDAQLPALPADMALRYLARVSIGVEDGLELAQKALDEAETDFTRTIAALSLAELHNNAHDHDRASMLLDLASSLDYPGLRARVLVEKAENRARHQDLEGAHADVVALLAGEVPPNILFEGLRLRLRLETVMGRVDEAMATAALFVSSFPLPEAAEARWYQVAAIQELNQEGAQLPALREAVAISRVHLSPGHTAHFCYALSGGYLQSERHVEAAEVLEESLRLLQDDQDDLRLQVLFRLGQVCRRLGEFRSSVQCLSEAADMLPAEEYGRRAFTLDALAAAQQGAGDASAAAAIYREAATLWQQAGDVSEAIGSLIEMASVLPAEEAALTRSALDEAEKLLPALEEPAARTHRQAEIAAIRAFLYAQAGDFALAVKHNREAESLAATLEEHGWRVFLVVRGARVLLQAGDPEGAEAEARRAADLLPDDGQAGDVVAVLSEALQRQNKAPGTDPLVRALTARLG